MTSKIFKSSYMSDSSRLEIETSIASTSFHITHCTVVSEKSFMFDNTTAPALALAILEAAGYTECDKMARDVARSHFGDAVESLAVGVGEQERAAAEAKEQAVLEAEALELVNTFWKRRDGFPLDNWDSEPGNAKQGWIAVAERAREMRAEK